jgi:hypothetical protein
MSKMITMDYLTVSYIASEEDVLGMEGTPDG